MNIIIIIIIIIIILQLVLGLKKVLRVLLGKFVRIYMSCLYWTVEKMDWFKKKALLFSIKEGRMAGARNQFTH